MKVCVKCNQEKPIEDFSFVGSRRPNLRRITCKECCNKHAKIYHLANKEKVHKRKKEYRITHLEEMREKERASRIINHERNLRNERALRSKYPERYLEASRKYNRENKEKRLGQGRAWYRRNKSKVIAKKARRHAAKLKATPEWANRFFMDEIYGLAMLRTEMLGVKMHVDHIIPLQGKLVCGLHVENNLQIIPATENLKKGNKLV